MERIGEHVVVMGGSMAGLAVAAVLADRFARVTVVERDLLPRMGEHRKGVPQGRHGHALLAAGMAGLDELLPGLTDDLRHAGAQLISKAHELRVHVNGGMLHQVDPGYETAAASRSLLEGVVRERVRDLDTVEIIDGHDIREVVLAPDGARAVGITIRDRASERERTLAADLVIDATGRGSRTPAWLEANGYPAPVEDRVQVGVHYTTRLFHRDPAAARNARMILIGSAPGVHRGGFAQAIEGDQWLVTLIGVLGTRPPEDLEGFVAYASTLLADDIHRIVADGAPASEAWTMSYPASVRRRYERLRRFPERFVVVGDAQCSFNPTYGQGMSVATQEALLLRDLVEAGLDRVGVRFFRRARRLVDVPWDQSVGADLRDPQVEGPRTLRWRLLQPYLDRVFRAAHRDPEVSRTLMHVLGLVARPEVLVHPRMVGRVLRLASARRSTAPHTGAALPAAGADAAPTSAVHV
jgi:2-polyprenyl-6-methoxyphenol hydroxylase-like FAD-dependent oxidoreductase